MRLILPKTLVPDVRLNGPIVFLAGPIKGGGEWQEQACRLLAEAMPEVIIAAPRRWNEEHPLSIYREAGDDSHFERQTAWERHYLERAARKGCILFWLPCESTDAPRTDKQPYARDTYGELGEWRARLMADPTISLVIGAEAEFPGLDVVSCNYDCALGRPFHIYSTLEETVGRAVELCRMAQQRNGALPLLVPDDSVEMVFHLAGERQIKRCLGLIDVFDWAANEYPELFKGLEKHLSYDDSEVFEVIDRLIMGGALSQEQHSRLLRPSPQLLGDYGRRKCELYSDEQREILGQVAARVRAYTVSQ